MFFSFLGILSYLIAKKRPTFSIGWSTLMATAGFLLACGVCVKYIGIFTLLQIQIMAFADVYLKIADKTIRAVRTNFYINVF